MNESDVILSEEAFKIENQALRFRIEELERDKCCRGLPPAECAGYRCGRESECAELTMGVLSEERIAWIEMEPWARDCIPLIDSHRALSALLAAERERRERAEEALRSFPNNHIQDGCIVIACPVCDYFSNYGSEG
ncbi:MAG: hypothetical protein WC565_03110 [Parcubacteria group bacterium]